MNLGGMFHGRCVGIWDEDELIRGPLSWMGRHHGVTRSSGLFNIGEHGFFPPCRNSFAKRIPNNGLRSDSDTTVRPTMSRIVSSLDPPHPHEIKDVNVVQPIVRHVLSPDNEESRSSD